MSAGSVLGADVGAAMLTTGAGFRREEVIGFVQVPPHEQCGAGQQGADAERDSPTPGSELRGRQQQLLEHQQHEDGAQLSADERHVLEARIETAVLLVGDLAEIRRARAVLASEAQALGDAGKAGVVEIVAIRSS